MSYKKILSNIYHQTELFKRKTIRETLNNYGPFENLLDVGCWDGKTTLDAISHTHVKNIYGVEPIKEFAKKADDLGIKTKSFYIDREEWEFEDNKFDCINSCEVIEHLTNVDFFIEQASKKLKTGGYLITTTNNLASFHNIFSLLFGWAPMDLTNSSIKKWSVGNPLSLHKNEDLSKNGVTWTHKCVYTPYWLSRWMELYDLEFVEYRGIGYYPLPPIVGKYLKKHAAFFTLVMKKK